MYAAIYRNIPGFDVTAEAVSDGVKLSWDDVAGVNFSLYRNNTAYGGRTELALLSSANKFNGVCTYYDIARDTNTLKAGTGYTYMITGQRRQSSRNVGLKRL